MRILVLLLVFIFSSSVQAAEIEDFRGFKRLKDPISLATLKVTTPLGTQANFKQWRGKWVLMNAWASWCAPCVAELPTLFQLAVKNPFPDKLAVIAVSFDANKTQQGVIDYLSERKIGTFAAYMDSGHALEEILKVQGLPVTYLIDPQGNAVADYRGSANWADPKVLQALSFFVNAGNISNKSATSP